MPVEPTRKRRKWDQPAPAVASNGQAAVAAVQPQGVPGIPDDAVERAKRQAQEVVARINAALTGKGPKLGRMAEELDPVHDEVVINDCPPGVRYQLTKRTLHEEVQRRTNTVVVIKGRYIAPGKPVDDQEGPLRLLVKPGHMPPDDGLRRRAVGLAVAEINNVLNNRPLGYGLEGPLPGPQPGPHQGPHLGPHGPGPHGPGPHGMQGRPGPGPGPQGPRPMPVQQQPPPQPAGPPHTVSLYIGVEAPPEWNLVRRIKGEGDAFLRHICSTTGADVVLRGRGSGEHESVEPLHLFVSCVNPHKFVEARDLCTNLIDTVRVDHKQAFTPKPVAPVIHAPPAGYSAPPAALAVPAPAPAQQPQQAPPPQGQQQQQGAHQGGQQGTQQGTQQGPQQSPMHQGHAPQHGQGQQQGQGQQYGPPSQPGGESPAQAPQPPPQPQYAPPLPSSGPLSAGYSWPGQEHSSGQPEARQLQQQQQALPLPAPLPAGEPPLPSDAPPESATQLAPQRAEQHGRQRASSAPGGQAPSIPPPGYSQYMQVPPGPAPYQYPPASGALPPFAGAGPPGHAPPQMAPYGQPPYGYAPVAGPWGAPYQPMPGAYPPPGAYGMPPDGRPLQAASHAPPYGGGQPQKQPPSPSAARQEQQQERKRRFQESKEPPQHVQQGPPLNPYAQLQQQAPHHNGPMYGPSRPPPQMVPQQPQRGPMGPPPSRGPQRQGMMGPPPPRQMGARPGAVMTSGGFTGLVAYGDDE